MAHVPRFMARNVWFEGKLLFNACDNHNYDAVRKCEKGFFGATTGLGGFLVSS